MGMESRKVTNSSKFPVILIAGIFLLLVAGFVLINAFKSGNPKDTAKTSYVKNSLSTPSTNPSPKASAPKTNVPVGNATPSEASADQDLEKDLQAVDSAVNGMTEQATNADAALSDTAGDLSE